MRPRPLQTRYSNKILLSFKICCQKSLHKICLVSRREVCSLYEVRVTRFTLQPLWPDVLIAFNANEPRVEFDIQHMQWREQRKGVE